MLIVVVFQNIISNDLLGQLCLAWSIGVD